MTLGVGERRRAASEVWALWLRGQSRAECVQIMQWFHAYEPGLPRLRDRQRDLLEAELYPVPSPKIGMLVL